MRHAIQCLALLRRCAWPPVINNGLYHAPNFNYSTAEQDGLSLRNINWEPLQVEPRRSCLTAGATERHRGILHHKPTQSITGLHAEQQACVLGTREELAEECVVEGVTRLVRRVPVSVRAYDPAHNIQHTTHNAHARRCGVLASDGP